MMLLIICGDANVVFIWYLSGIYLDFIVLQLENLIKE